LKIKVGFIESPEKVPKFIFKNEVGTLATPEVWSGEWVGVSFP